MSRPQPRTTYTPIYAYLETDRTGVAVPSVHHGHEYTSIKMARKNAKHKGSTILVREYGREPQSRLGYIVLRAYEIPVKEDSDNGEDSNLTVCE